VRETLVGVWASGLVRRCLRGRRSYARLLFEEQEKERKEKVLSPHGRPGDARPRDHGRRALEAPREPQVGRGGLEQRKIREVAGRRGGGRWVEQQRRRRGRGRRRERHRPN